MTYQVLGLAGVGTRWSRVIPILRAARKLSERYILWLRSTVFPPIQPASLGGRVTTQTEGLKFPGSGLKLKQDGVQLATTAEAQRGPRARTGPCGLESRQPSLWLGRASSVLSHVPD